MKSSNDGGEKNSTEYLLSPNEAFSTGFELHLKDLLVRGAPWDSPNNPGSYRDNRLLSINSQQNPMAKDNAYTGH